MLESSDLCDFCVSSMRKSFIHNLLKHFHSVFASYLFTFGLETLLCLDFRLCTSLVYNDITTEFLAICDEVLVG